MSTCNLPNLLINKMVNHKSPGQLHHACDTPALS
uniref:Uncharacterized protein n=1 Tax=Ciona intestinalis TaxID=7719 RepID=H2XQ64_CIOIN